MLIDVRSFDLNMGAWVTLAAGTKSSIPKLHDMIRYPQYSSTFFASNCRRPTKGEQRTPIPVFCLTSVGVCCAPLLPSLHALLQPGQCGAKSSPFFTPTTK